MDNPENFFSDIPGSISGKPGNRSTNIDLLMDVNLRITVELGRTYMTLRQVLELQQGAVIELDRLAGDPVDIFINERLFAQGEVIVVDDKFGVRITRLIETNNAAGSKA